MADETRVTLPGSAPASQLEARLHLPAGAGPRGAGRRVAAVIVCHPYPPAGGSLLVKVVGALARELAGRGVGALRFNFRGVGASTGTFDGGRGEVDDAGAALDWLASREEVDAGRLGVVGYSFGALVGARLFERDPRPRALAMISPPLSGRPAIPLPAGRPWLLVTGDRDPLCPAAALPALADGLGAAGTTRVIRDADHAFTGRERQLAGAVSRFLVEELGSER